MEFLFPHEHSPEVVAERLRRHGLAPALSNLPSGDQAAGDRGLAALPHRRPEMRAAFEAALPCIGATGVPHVLMAGHADHSAASRGAFHDAVAWPAERLAAEGVTLLLEPLNTRDDPGHPLTDLDGAAALTRDLALPNLPLQFDLHHAQIPHGDVTRPLEATMPPLGHVQVTSVPSRHEPDGEEPSHAHLWALLDRLGDRGWVGLEHRPRGGTLVGLGWTAACGGGP